MPVPTLITDLSTTIASNSPLGSESPASLDDYQRAQAAFIAQLYANTVASTTIIVASAATTAIGAAASENVDISGTTTITSFGTVAEGINRKGRFTGALILTHNATSLILPGVANITTAANDRYEARSLGAGNWIVTKYQQASTSLNVLHTTGNESKAGILTLLDNPVVSSASAAVSLRDTGQSLPNGLWALQSLGNELRVIRNTAAAGDFSTITIPVKFGPTDAAIFTNTVTGIDATAPTHLTTKQQLDAKVFGGRVTGGATPIIAYGPAGWTVSRSSVGQFIITHNLGTFNYSYTLTLVNGFSIITPIINANNFSVFTYSSAAALIDVDFNFIVVRN